jgi:hypothetical protein
MSFRKILFVGFLFFAVNANLLSQRFSGDTAITVIDSAYSFSDSHCNSVYYFHTNGKWGTLTDRKQVFFPAEYDTLIFLKQTSDYKGIFVGFMARKNGNYGILGDNQKLDESFIYDTIYGQYSTNGFLNYFVARKNGKYGIISYTGKVIVPFAYDYESSMIGEYNLPFRIMVNKQEVFSVSRKKPLLFCFQVNDSLQAWGLDKKMGVILQCTKKDSLFPVNGTWSDDGNFYTAYFKKDTVYRDHNGDGITLPLWAKNVTRSYDENYYFVQTNSGHFGIANKKLNMVTDTIFRNYCPSPTRIFFGNKYCYFMQKAVPGKTMYDFEGDWVMTNERGKQINDLTFYKPYDYMHSLELLTDDKTYMCDGDGKWGQINTNLKWTLQPQYDTIWTLFWDTLSDRTSLMVKENGKYEILDSGKIIVPFNYTKAIFGFGGTAVILKNEKEIVVYEPERKRLLNFDSLLLYLCKTYSPNGYYYDNNYHYGQGQHSPHLLSSTEKKLIRSDYLLEKTVVQIRLTNGEIFSPLLYSPDLFDPSNAKEEYAYPFYQPKPTYVPWFHYLTFCPDSDFFSFSYYYNMYNENWGHNYNKVQIVNYEWGIFHYDFPKQDSISYINYSIRGDTCYPITLDSIFRKDISVDQELKRMFLDEIKKYKIQLPDGDWTLYDHFYLTQKAIVLLFQCSEKDKKGNTQIYGMNFYWPMVSTLLDPKGPLGNKILKGIKEQK